MHIYIHTYTLIYNFWKLAAKFQAWPLLCAPQTATCCRWELGALLHASLFMVNLYQFKEISLFRHLHINSVKLWFQISTESPEWGPQNTPQWRLQRKQNHGGWAWLTVRLGSTLSEWRIVVNSGRPKPKVSTATAAARWRQEAPKSTILMRIYFVRQANDRPRAKRASGQTAKRPNGPKQHCSAAGI